MIAIEVKPGPTIHHLPFVQGLRLDLYQSIVYLPFVQGLTVKIWL